MPDTDFNSTETSVDDLQARLAERDRLVAELTSRLEMAAEQLDRLKRSGADRGARIVGGIPPELVEEQRALAEELQLAVQQWSEMDPAALLSRLEMQVGEVRDLIVNRLAAPGATGATAGPALPGPTDDADGRLAGGSGEAADAKPSDAASGLSTYEAFKAGLLGTAEDAPPPAAAPSSASDASAAPSDAPSAPESVFPSKPAAAQPPPEIPAVEPPEPIDVDNAGLDELREAVDRRDSYIGYLIRKLRAAETASRPAGSWSDLEGVPEEAAERLHQYEKQLQELLRTAEVETSLERARLGREANRLALLEQMLEKRMQRLGISDADGDSPDDDFDEEAFEDEESPRKKRRRLFGLFGRDEE